MDHLRVPRLGSRARVLYVSTFNARRTHRRRGLATHSFSPEMQQQLGAVSTLSHELIVKRAMAQVFEGVTYGHSIIQGENFWLLPACGVLHSPTCLRPTAMLSAHPAHAMHPV